MAQVTVDTFKSKVILPIVGGYDAAIATGAIPDTNPPSLTLPAPVSVEATGPLTPSPMATGRDRRRRPDPDGIVPAGLRVGVRGRSDDRRLRSA